MPILDRLRTARLRCCRGLTADGGFPPLTLACPDEHARPAPLGGHRHRCQDGSTSLQWTCSAPAAVRATGPSIQFWETRDVR